MTKAHHAPSHPNAPPPPAELEQRIRTRAYELYLQRKADPGHELEDWLRAEQEVRTDGPPPATTSH